MCQPAGDTKLKVKQNTWVEAERVMGWTNHQIPKVPFFIFWHMWRFEHLSCVNLEMRSICNSKELYSGNYNWLQNGNEIIKRKKKGNVN